MAIVGTADRWRRGPCRSLRTSESAGEAARSSSASDDLLEIPESITGRRISYASSDAVLLPGKSARQSALRPETRAAARTTPTKARRPTQRNWEVDEARKAGNPDYDCNSDWIDYAAAGATGPEDLFAGLARCSTPSCCRGTFSISACAPRSTRRATRSLSDGSSRCARPFATRLESEGPEQPRRSFEPGAYNTEATVGENLLFGTATGPALIGKALAANPYFSSVAEASRTGPNALRHGTRASPTTPSNCSATCRPIIRSSSNSPS